MECNDEPLLDEVNEAMNRRMRMVLFESLYTDEETLKSLTDKTNVYLADPYYKTNDFKNKYKQTWFNILLKAFKKFKDLKYTLPNQPPKCKEKCKNFLATSDDIFGWFNEHYVVNEEKNSSPLTLTSVYSEFASSMFYELLSKNDKRKFNRKNFIEKIETNIFLKRNIILKNKNHNNVQIKADSIIGWKLRPSDDEKVDIPV
jgi:phage/plasmid-associated DNA primase